MRPLRTIHDAVTGSSRLGISPGGAQFGKRLLRLEIQDGLGRKVIHIPEDELVSILNYLSDDFYDEFGDV